MKSLARSASFLLIAAVCLTAVTPSAVRAQREPAGGNTAIKPVPREKGWLKRHEGFNQQVKQGDFDLVFIGDSITDGWRGNGKEVWQKYYGHRKALNLGIGGDRTQHVLWRLENGNVDGIHPKLAVVMIGTNNSNNDDYTAEEIADGIKAIVAKLREKLPETKILLLGVFPRGPMSDAQLTKSIARDEKKKSKEGQPANQDQPADKIAAARDYTKRQRQKLAEVNQSIAKIADNKSVFYLDIGPKFLPADGVLPDDTMPDWLHLSPAGYQIWAEAIEPKVHELLGEKATTKDAGSDANKQSSADAKKLQGTWNAVSYKADGESVDPKESPVRWVFTDDMFRLMADVDEAVIWGNYKLDTSPTPHSIDLSFPLEPDAAKPQTALGIYELSDKQFKICYDAEGTKRPTQFESKTGSNLIEIVFEKVTM